MDDSGKKALLSGISEKADIEIERIKKSSNETIAFKLERAHQQASDILATAEKNTEAQLEQIRRTALSGRTMAQRKASLDCDDQLNNLAVKKMFSKLNDAISTKEYEGILLSLVVEASLALNGDHLTVNSSMPERIFLTKDFFNRASSMVAGLANRKVTYQLDEGNALLAQGIIVENADKSMLYDNTMNSRFMRYRDRIRAAMASKLFIKENA